MILVNQQGQVQKQPLKRSLKVKLVPEAQLARDKFTNRMMQELVSTQVIGHVLIFRPRCVRLKEAHQGPLYES